MVYSTVVSEALFGTGEFGVRFPSAFYGILMILVFFLITREFLMHSPEFKNRNINLISAMMSVFLAISPWAINFSRQNFESNGAVFFLMLGTYFLIKFNRKPSSLVLSAVFYVISIYFYYSVRLIIPFILLFFLITQYRKLRENLKITAASMAV